MKSIKIFIKKGWCDCMLEILAILWCISPVILIPMTIILSIKNSKLKKMLSDSYDIMQDTKARENTRKSLTLSIVLIIGVLFVTIAECIFATTNWDYMSGAVKMIFMISMSIVFFIASMISEKKLELKRTGFAFFTAGGIFLPVAVAGMAFFELAGSWFTFDGEGESYVILLMIITTVAVLIAGDIKYKGSKVVKYIFGTLASFLYIPYVTIVASNIDSTYSDKYFNILIILLSAGFISSLFIPHIKIISAQILLFGSEVLLILEENRFVVAIVFAISSVFLLMFSLKPLRYLGASAIATSILLIVKETGYKYGLNLDTVKVLYLAIPATISLILYLPFFNEKKVFKHIHYAIDSCIFITAFLNWNDISYLTFKSIMMLVMPAIYFIASSFISISECERNIRLSFASVLITFSLIISGGPDILDIPSIIEVEYVTIISLLSSFALRFLWKKYHPVATERLIFIHIFAVFAVLLFNAMDTEELINILIITTLSAILLVISYSKRSKKWFVLSSVSLLMITLYLTQEIWTEISWWVYLLAIGIIFILFAGSKEYYRIKGKEPEILAGIRKFRERFKAD